MSVDVSVDVSLRVSVREGRHFSGARWGAGTAAYASVSALRTRTINTWTRSALLLPLCAWEHERTEWPEHGARTSVRSRGKTRGGGWTASSAD